MTTELRRASMATLFFLTVALTVDSARAQPFRLVDPATGRLAAFAELAGPTLVIHSGAMRMAYSRRIDLDGPGFQCFQLPGADQFVQWPAVVPGLMCFGGIGPGGVIAWSPVKKEVRPMGLPPGTVVLKRREIVPNPPLGPLEVAFNNNHTEDLLLGFVDLRKPDYPPRPREHTIPPGTTKKFLLDRDAGAEIVTVYDLTLPNGAVVEQVERVPIPPARIWDVVVWEYKVTYQVVGKPELTMKSRRSLGVLYLPPGAAMPPAIDAYREAVEANNPGAAAAYLVPKP